MTTAKSEKATALSKPVVTTGLIDVDIHPLPKVGGLNEYLPTGILKQLDEYGMRSTTGLQLISEYPQMYGNAMRADAWPEDGYPGSDLDLMRTQLLDLYNIELGVLQCLSPGGQTLNPAGQALNPELGSALCSALNDYQIEHLVHPEPRLRVSMAITFEAPDLAVKEIERVGSDPAVISILGLSKTMEPLGSRKYWPIYEAAVAHNLPIQVHLSQGGGHANTGTGWTSYHAEYHVGHVQSIQSQMLSLILQGVFDRFPGLKIMFVEGNVAHFVPLIQRLDYHWKTLRSEVPNLQRKPSEYIYDHVWASTQPIDEPQNPRHLQEIIEEFCPDNVLFASDYPHFDFDSPETVFPASFSPELKEKIFRTNGMRFFGLENEGK
ncbi:amidohydrolase family protein [Arthrobacter sp. SLBN-112]|uniref:amidohydrolase family protein n=1 Tax=Arthrobacter sp. SLBN-112 TaxID=2768452 RepID=UPI0027B2CA13|nr:amidohydrolase family protein [Arthrobacter sp. SLBN-112]MDQ0799501.1 putative TIM-barrel fold metal-dependent hydrolase [Arthrobacter sp. SLBN-112]